MSKKPDFRTVATLLAAALLVSVSAAVFLLTEPAKGPPAISAPPIQSPDNAEVTAGEELEEAPEPQILRLSVPDECIVVNGGVYTGVKAHLFKNKRLRGLFVYSTCKKDPVIADVKTSKQNLVFVSSQLPLNTVLREPHHPENNDKDKFILLDRGGDKCDEMKEPSDTCRYIAIPHRHVLILPIEEMRYFSIRLKGGKKIEGYLAPPDGAPPVISPPIKNLNFD